MSKLQAKIYTTTDTSNPLIFTNRDIVAISSNTKVIENETTPSFDILPNSGSLVVKDTNLNLYNKALNGEFDEFRYVVEFYINNKLFACHIINQRPYYDYEAKTCTFYLGNAIDYTTTAPYNGYVYPLQSQSLYTIFYNLMVDIFGISDNDFSTLVNATFGKYQTLDDYFTFAEYFQEISITYPYIGQTTQREALRTVLLMAQCGLILDRNNKFKLIRLDGYTTTANLFDNTYIINENQTKQGFIPSIILDNKYNGFYINYNTPTTEYQIDKLVFNGQFDKENVGITTITPTYDDALSQDGSSIDLGLGRYFVFVAQQKLTKFSIVNKQIFVSFYQNNNLKNILNMSSTNNEDGDITNPRITCICKKTIKKETGNLNCYTTGEWNFAVDTTQPATTTEEIVSINSLISDEPFDVYFEYENYDPALSVSTKIIADETSTITNLEEMWGDKEFLCSIDVVGEKQYENCYASKTSTTSNHYQPFIDAKRETVTYELLQIELSYNGDYTEIIFSNNNDFNLLEDSTKQTANTFSLNNNLEVVQSTALFAKNNTNLIENIGNSLLNVFENGLHTGEITVIHDDYNTLYNYAYNLEENFDGFYVFTPNPITKTLNKLRIKALPKKVIVTNTSSTTNTYELTHNKYSDDSFEIVFNEDTNSLTFSYKGSGDGWFIKKCVVKYNVNTETEEIGVSKNKQFFENGDKVIPCKNNIPIMQVNNQPIVYQVVDNDISIEGGVAFQKLILREVKQL